MQLREILICVAVIAAVNAEYKQFKNHKVYKIVPQSVKDVEVLSAMQEERKWYFWSDIIKIDGDVRIMVAPEMQKEFEDYLDKVGVHTNVIIEDVQKQIDDQLRRPSGRSVSEYDWTYYQTLDEINAWLDVIAAEYPDVVSIVTMGSSVEGRPIRGVKIDFKKQENPTIAMIEGGIHAREWISPATVTWIIKDFLKSRDSGVRALAENIVWHIFPVVNPDGYLYTFSNNRMWRKNRNTANYTSCAQWNMDSDLSNGIDLNRNFGFLWNSVGASQDACSEVFSGPTSFSEPEAVAISNYVHTLQREGNLVYYFAFHSYSQMVLVPYSHLGGADVIQTPNYADMFEIAIRGMDKLKEKYGTHYIVGTSLDILYPTSGGSFDWVKAGANVPIVYLFELRDVGQYGFLLPTQFIIPNNEEIIDGLVEMDRVTRHLGYYTYSSASKFGVSAVVFALAIIFAL